MVKYDRNEYSSRFLFLLDVVSFSVAYFVACYFRFYSNYRLFAISYVNLFVVGVALTLFLSLFRFSNYKSFLKIGFWKEFSRCFQIVSLTILFSVFSFFVLKTSASISRLFVLYLYLYYLGFDYLFRILCKLIERHKIITNKKKRRLSKPAFVFTDADSVCDIVSEIEKDMENNYETVGVLVANGELKEPLCQKSIKFFSEYQKALNFICRNYITDAFVLLKNGSEYQEIFVKTCLQMGINIHLEYYFDANLVQTDTFGSHNFVSAYPSFVPFWSRVVKRVFDIVCGFFGSIFTLLLALILGPIIYINSPGPIFFKQTRIGKDGKKFNFYKFRSMCIDADAKKAEYMKQNRVDGLMFKLDWDPRIIGNKVLPDGTHKTGIGEFIRKTSLDEFPQFFNVLLGDMSFVGTRPPTVDEWEKYLYHHRARLCMKPGITGMWQVSGRSEITDFEEVVKLDMKYINNFKLSLDIKILFKTFLVLLTGKGAM